ncbi:MAG TPA: hypothetical protein VIF02_10845 [Methylocella sp.]
MPAMGSDYARLCKKTFWFDEHDQVRARPPVKLVCNVLRQRLSFFVFLRNHIKDRVVGFAAREKSCSPRDARNSYLERKPVGDVIVLKSASGRVNLMTSPVGHGTVVVFTGIWQERLQDKDNETKRARRVRGKRSRKSGGKPGGVPQK